MTRQERLQAGYEVSDDSESEEEDGIDEDAEEMVGGPVTFRQHGQRNATDGKFCGSCFRTVFRAVGTATAGTATFHL